jgi:hypothetical protein
MRILLAILAGLAATAVSGLATVYIVFKVMVVSSGCTYTKLDPCGGIEMLGILVGIAIGCMTGPVIGFFVGRWLIKANWQS